MTTLQPGSRPWMSTRFLEEHYQAFDALLAVIGERSGERKLTRQSRGGKNWKSGQV